MKALRVQVERVVRPIRASYLRKDRMREELLAHLTRLFDEELTRTGDAQWAMSEAIHRFGDATQLARELQASVPRLERWAFLSVPYSAPIRRRKGESPVRYVLRANCLGWALGTVAISLFALVLATIVSLRPHRADQPTASQMFLLLMGTAAIQIVLMICQGLLCEGIRQQLERRAAAATAFARRRATWRIVGYSSVSSVVLGAAFAGLMLLIDMFSPIPFITRAQFWWIILAVVVFGLPLTLLQSWSWKANTRRFENWDSLDLDEQQAA
jgi:hypothetical protein